MKRGERGTDRVSEPVRRENKRTRERERERERWAKQWAHRWREPHCFLLQAVHKEGESGLPALSADWYPQLLLLF